MDIPENNMLSRLDPYSNTDLQRGRERHSTHNVDCRFCLTFNRHTHEDGSAQPFGLQPYKRMKMISELKKFCDEGENAFFNKSEEFTGDDHGTGIWTGGEGEPSKDGQGLWDYWSGNHPEIDKFLAKRGWYQEWHDAGTVMLYPI